MWCDDQEFRWSSLGVPATGRLTGNVQIGTLHSIINIDLSKHEIETDAKLLHIRENGQIIDSCLLSKIKFVEYNTTFEVH